MLPNVASYLLDLSQRCEVYCIFVFGCRISLQIHPLLLVFLLGCVFMFEYLCLYAYKNLYVYTFECYCYFCYHFFQLDFIESTVP